jgi:hypothetical protein
MSGQRVAPDVREDATGWSLPHGDHAHFIPWQAAPRVNLRCEYCRRLIRPLSVVPFHIAIEGQVLRENGTVVIVVPGKRKLPAADIIDVSPAGTWNSRFQIVCRHHGQQKSGASLNRLLKAEGLLAMYLDAVCQDQRNAWLGNSY